MRRKQLEKALNNLIRKYGFEHEVTLKFANHMEGYLHGKKGSLLACAIVYGKNMDHKLYDIQY